MTRPLVLSGWLGSSSLCSHFALINSNTHYNHTTTLALVTRYSMEHAVWKAYNIAFTRHVHNKIHTK